MYEHSSTDAGKCGSEKGRCISRERMVKDHWSNIEYEVVCQVANDMPMYEIKDSSSNVKVTHHNQLFLVATPQGAITPLCENTDPQVSMTTQPTLAELTPLELDDLPEKDTEEQLAQCSTSTVPLGWVDGILQPLPTVVPSTAYKYNGHRARDKHESDDEIH